MFIVSFLLSLSPNYSSAFVRVHTIARGNRQRLGMVCHPFLAAAAPATSRFLASITLIAPLNNMADH